MEEVVVGVLLGLLIIHFKRVIELLIRLIDAIFKKSTDNDNNRV
jgi:hypothetical protein